ncbi:MAG: hypothetical protein ACP5XB_15045, partial [Isosphaeraceae bacterium]
ELKRDEGLAAAGTCACGSQPPKGNLNVNGRTIVVTGLPLIFEHLKKQGLEPGDGSSERLLETVRIYHAIDPAEEDAYRTALAGAYQAFCQPRFRSAAQV